MWRCKQCKEECDDDFDVCWNCGAGRDGAPAEAVFEAERVEEDLEVMSLNAQSTGKGGRRSLVPRYADAYLVARSTTDFGSTLKVIAILMGIVVAIAGAILGSQTELGGVFDIAWILTGVITALPIYILGILVSAQGQILKATVDTAVNTSPLLTKDEMRKMLSLD